jgi:hypothetical protein
MRIKIIIFIFIFCGKLAINSSAQSVNIWDITNSFLVENGYKSQGDYSRPTKIKGDYIVQPYFIFGLGGEINNPDFVIPNHDKLDRYSFGSIFRHYYMHLLYVKTGKWRIIDMGKPLLDIIMKCHDLCKDFGLDDKEAVFVIKDVIRFYEGHLENVAAMGVPIVLDSAVIRGTLPMLSFEQEANVRDIAYNFLIDNGYAESNGATVIEKDDICIRYDDSDISDSEFTLPNYNVLQFMSFGISGELNPQHLLFFKTGKWRIVDMGKHLLDIIIQSHNLCKDLELSDNESIYVINEVIKYYESHNI